MNTAVNQFNYRFKLTDYAMFDRNRQRRVAIYGRVSTEHEAQLSALENQMQWYEDQAKYHPNWTVLDKYIDEANMGDGLKISKKLKPYFQFILPLLILFILIQGLV